MSKFLEIFIFLLENRYPNLCRLCPERKCITLPEDNDGHLTALHCLTQNRGEVAFTDLHTTTEFLKVLY